MNTLPAQAAAWPVYTTFPYPSLRPPQNIFQKLQGNPENLPTCESSKLHQWPWRGFAFASDLGTVGALLKQPGLGVVGWLIALPYYAYALLSEQPGQKRKEEMLYQVTANGFFPLIEAKIGIVLGHLLEQKLKRVFPDKLFTRFRQPVYRLGGGLLAVAALTPLAGDPVSRHLMNRYRLTQTQNLQ
jgi:hypothetical protein